LVCSFCLAHRVQPMGFSSAVKWGGAHRGMGAGKRGRVRLTLPTCGAGGYER
jgi:hypothetical protein